MAGRPRWLTIQTWSAFTVFGNPEVRWDKGKGKDGKGITESNVIVGAKAFIVGEGRISAHGTDKNEGKTRLDIGRLEGRHVLRLVPNPDRPEMVSLEPAGPKTGATLVQYQGGEKSTKKGPRLPERMYRPLDIILHVRDGKLVDNPAPYVDPKMTHGSVLRFSEDFIEVDWKPDWVKAPSVRPRAEGTTPLVIILHRTGELNPDKPGIGSALNTFLTSDVNAHYVVDVDGHVVKMVMETDEASHAGADARWLQVGPVNSFSIGIEIVNDKGKFPPEQTTGVARLLRGVMKAFRISRHRVLGHCEVKPFMVTERKNRQGEIEKFYQNDRIRCPGLEFDWVELEKQYLATSPVRHPLLWFPYKRFFEEFPDEALVLGNKDERYDKRTQTWLPALYGRVETKRVGYGALISQLQAHLEAIGYERAEKDGEYTRHTMRVVQRFQARYFTASRKQNPTAQEPNGVADRATIVAVCAVLGDRTFP